MHIIVQIILVIVLINTALAVFGGYIMIGFIGGIGSMKLSENEKYKALIGFIIYVGIGFALGYGTYKLFNYVLSQKTN
jgi:hypothetical protein